MTNRRNFIKTAAMVSAAVVLNPFEGKAEETPNFVSKKGKKPIVLSEGTEKVFFRIN
jgi:N4-(beta-N-acetylglucosaminyl)-L-asparaginase